MKRPRSTREILASLCSHVHEEDGVPPRRRERTDRSGRDRKLDQLCSQVARTLVFVLQGECHDECLSALQVVEVVPAPDASRLRVRLSLPDGSSAEDLLRARERLAAAEGRIRSEIARSIRRKKAPMLLSEVEVGEAKHE